MLFVTLSEIQSSLDNSTLFVQWKLLSDCKTVGLLNPILLSQCHYGDEISHGSEYDKETCYSQ